LITPFDRFASGTIVRGHDRIEAPLDDGSLRATQLNLDRPVEIRAFLPSAVAAQGPEAFRAAAAALQRVDHPNVPRILELGIAAEARDVR
jgi:hypothetical protein